MTTSSPHSSARHALAARLHGKVPEVTISFWVIKVLTTGMGEAASDYLAHTYGPLPAVAGTGAVLAVALGAQFSAGRYISWVYWSAVVMVSVFGTLAADGARIGLGLSYWVSTAGFSVALAAVFALWRAVEGTLSIHSIVTRRREAFYWATVMTTFALGTAWGDLTARTLHLGFLKSGLLFAGAIAVPALAHRWARLGAVPAFWLAYILTRPLGASFADWMAVGRSSGGLNLGLGPVTVGWAALIVALVGYLSLSRRDVPDDEPIEARPIDVHLDEPRHVQLDQPVRVPSQAPAVAGSDPTADRESTGGHGSTGASEPTGEYEPTRAYGSTGEYGSTGASESTGDDEPLAGYESVSEADLRAWRPR